MIRIFRSKIKILSLPPNSSSRSSMDFQRSIAKRVKTHPIFLFSKYNYRIEVITGQSIQRKRNVLWVFDSGARLNLIRAGILATQTRSRIVKEAKIVNLATTSKHRLSVIGILPLSVAIGSQATRIYLVVVNKRGADVILGCQYIDTAVDEINVKKGTQGQKNG